MNKLIRNKQLVYLILSILFWKELLFPDAAGYAGNKAIIVKNDKITIIHRHDWSQATKKTRQRMFWGDQNTFTNQNCYAYIECVNNENHDVLFKAPTPALTHIFIDSESRYILGLSNIKLTNPYQLILLDRLGKLVYFESISHEEAILDNKKYMEFRNKFPNIFNKLEKRNLIVKVKELYYLNYRAIPIGNRASAYLFNYLGPSHLSKKFTESETNFIDWYKTPNPEIQLSYNEIGMVTAISLLDPAGDRFEIQVNVNRDFK